MISKDLAEVIAMLGNVGQLAEGTLAVVAAFVAWRFGLIGRLKEFRRTKLEEVQARHAEDLWAKFWHVQTVVVVLESNEGKPMRRERLEHWREKLNAAFLDLVEQRARADLVLPEDVINGFEPMLDAALEFMHAADVCIGGPTAANATGHDQVTVHAVSAEAAKRWEEHRRQLQARLRKFATLDEAQIVKAR